MRTSLRARLLLLRKFHPAADVPQLCARFQTESCVSGSWISRAPSLINFQLFESFLAEVPRAFTSELM